MEASQIIVYILAAALALFLLLAIILVILFIKIAMQIKRVTDTVERAAIRFEDIAALVQKVAAPAMVAKLANDLVQKFFDKKHKAKEGE